MKMHCEKLASSGLGVLLLGLIHRLHPLFVELQCWQRCLHVLHMTLPNAGQLKFFPFPSCMSQYGCSHTGIRAGIKMPYCQRLWMPQSLCPLGLILGFSVPKHTFCLNKKIFTLASLRRHLNNCRLASSDKPVADYGVFITSKREPRCVP